MKIITYISITCILSLLMLRESLAESKEIKLSAEHIAFFENKIRPVLSEHCYDCHNSVKKSKGGLALDYKQAMLDGGDSGKLFIAGKPKQSLLIKVIRHLEGVEKMPSKSPKLVDEVILDFEKWISMGAPDPRNTKPTVTSLQKAKPSWKNIRDNRKKWWSFQAIKKHKVPTVNNKEWQDNPIDAFVYKNIKEQNLTHSREADRYTLIRRLSFTLTGLPPKVEDVKQFVNDKDPKAYENLVDRLLSSHEYGERYARHWMDWYRYAESHGSEGNPAINNAGIYRDYLIRALNQDVPYNQLIKEHLAGDLIKKPRINNQLKLNESTIGIAQLRMHPYGYGVVDAYAEQINFTDNQVDVISKATMALTVSCARCHNHKFDPISQKDYYRFFGIMVSTRPTKIIVNSPSVLDKNKNKIASIKVKIRKALSVYWSNQINDNVEKRLSLYTQKKNPAASHALSLMHSVNKHGDEKIQEFLKKQEESTKSNLQNNKKIIAESYVYFDLRKPETMAKFFPTGNGSHKNVSPAGGFALKSAGDLVLQGIYPAGVYSHLISDKHAAVFGSPRFTVKGGSLYVRSAGRNSSRRYAVRHYPYGGLLHDNQNLSNPQLLWNSSRRLSIWEGEKIHYEVKTGNDVVSRNGKNNSWWGISEIILSKQRPHNIGAPLSLFREDTLSIKDKKQLIKVYREVLTKAVDHWANNNLNDYEAEYLDSFVRANILENKLDELPDSIKTLIHQYRELEKQIVIPTRSPGIYEGDVIDQELLSRGDHKKETDPVPRGFLEVFGDKMYSKDNSGRLELAEDLISDKNPLTSRVLVNRLWNYTFGQGLVTSTDNFGRMGRKPSHPELLDYLSLYLKDNNWSIKKTLRLMVTSRTFKAESQSSLSAKEKDPANRYLSFHTPRRMDAEAIYDSLYFLAGIKKRGVYDNVNRNKLNPFLAVFNRPEPSSTVSRRNNNNVPAQALTMMNGLAQQKSGQILSKVDIKKSQIDGLNNLFMYLYSRKITKKEIAFCNDFLGKEPSQDHWRQLTAALLNSKEFIYVH